MDRLCKVCLVISSCKKYVEDDDDNDKNKNNNTSIMTIFCYIHSSKLLRDSDPNRMPSYGHLRTSRAQ
jgi:hypothetical protein